MKTIDELREELEKFRRELTKWGSNWTPSIDNLGTDDEEWTGGVHFKSDCRDDDIFEVVPDEDYSVDLIRHLCALHNAAPLVLDLLEACRKVRTKGGDLPFDVGHAQQAVLESLRKSYT